MRTGIAVWNFKEKGLLENIEQFARAGFRAVSHVGGQFVKLDDDTLTGLADLLHRHERAFTIHHKLPDPGDPEECDAFAPQTDIIRQFHDERHPLAGLTFDTWYDIGRLLPHLRYALETFADTDVFICCEDFPLNEEQRLLLDGLDETYPNLGILIDLGHLNLRVTKEDPEQDMAAAVRRHLRAVPLTIRELHVHNNDGLSDQHQRLGVGTLPVEAAAAQLREIGFDGISTTEFVPEWNDIHGREAYDLAIDAARQWELLLGDNA